MAFERFGEFTNGYNTLTEVGVKHADMMMDTGIYVFETNQVQNFIDHEKESAFLILEGHVVIEWNNNKQDMKRNSIFDENPYCLHVPKGIEVKINALGKSEVLIIKTENDKLFDPVFYAPTDIKSDILGNGVWNNTARRGIRTVFDYSNAPYSNMVVGEVITYPGRWSSYIPHHHPQPEVYYYRFNKKQGFGTCVIGDDAYKITHNSIAAIPGGLVHPQSSAPGYAMYYCWMIRHLENNPWTDRIDEPEHKWLLEPNAVIWPVV